MALTQCCIGTLVDINPLEINIKSQNKNNNNNNCQRNSYFRVHETFKKQKNKLKIIYLKDAKLDKLLETYGKTI